MFYKQLLGNIDGGDVLDVGCGSGQFTSILVNSLASFNSITGIDVDEEVLKNARESFPGKDIVFQTASSHNLPFNDNSFDMAVISKALHHLENPERGLNEMYRVLKPGGLFLLIVDIHAKPTTTEPQTLAWNLISVYFPQYKILEEKHLERSVKNKIYTNSRKSKPVSNEKIQSGVLKVKLQKV